MNIYPAYTYKHTNKETGEFYIGYRRANKTTPEEDFPIYITSGKIKQHIKENPDKWISEIIQLFYEENKGEDAFWAEQNLIKENWGNPLLINRYYMDKKNKHKIFYNKSHSEETKMKMRGSRPNARKPSKRKGKKYGPQKNPSNGRTKEHRESLSQSLKHKPKTEKHKTNISISLKGRKAWNKGIKTGPMNEEFKQNKKVEYQKRPTYYCELCDMYIKSEGNWSKHLNSKRHLNNFVCLY